MYHNLKDGAILVSDSHFNLNRIEFLTLLDRVESLKPPQIILFGDIFDLLVAEVDYTVEFNQNVIDKLNSLSKDIEIIYLEGNHDFNLKKIFKNIKTIPRELQPIEFNFNGVKILASHGDSFESFQYSIYSKVIRNRLLLSALNYIDTKIFKEKIVKYIFNWLKDKRICREFKNFDSKIDSRVREYLSKFEKIDFIIEGHFHQDRRGDFSGISYLNLPSFACDKSFFIIKSNLKERVLFSKVSLRSIDVSE